MSKNKPKKVLTVLLTVNMISNDKFCGLKQPKNTKTSRFREVLCSLMGFAFAKVDPERFELSSKQGINKLSTKFRINLVFDSSQAFIQTKLKLRC